MTRFACVPAASLRAFRPEHGSKRSQEQRKARRPQPRECDKNRLENATQNGSKMPPRRRQNRSQIAPKWLPEASRAHPKSGNDNWSLFCSFCSPLGRLLGRSWVALGRAWRCALLKRFSLKRETWLSWNGKRAQSESCKHGKKGKSSESSKNRESQSASTMRRSSARAARPARASKRHSNTTAYALAQPLRGLAGRGAYCSAAKAASLAR